MFKNKIGEDSPIPKFIYLKIRRRDGVESLTTLKEGEFNVPIVLSVLNKSKVHIDCYIFRNSNNKLALTDIALNSPRHHGVLHYTIPSNKI